MNINISSNYTNTACNNVLLQMNSLYILKRNLRNHIQPCEMCGGGGNNRSPSLFIQAAVRVQNWKVRNVEHAAKKHMQIINAVLVNDKQNDLKCFFLSYRM